MKTLRVVLATLVSAVTLGGAGSAMANEEQGVQCPSGFQATISDGNRLLKCSKPKRVEYVSACLTGSINTIGSDMCNPLVTGKSSPSGFVMNPLDGVPAGTQFTRVVHETGPDKFVATFTEYAWPIGSALGYAVGDKSKGVRCPAGYDGDVKFNGNGIRCDKNDGAPKLADCDFPWSWLRDANGNEDRCTLANQTGPTKPQGITYIQYQAENALPNIRWKREVKNGHDTFQRIQFAYPNHIN